MFVAATEISPSLEIVESFWSLSPRSARSRPPGERKAEPAALLGRRRGLGGLRRTGLGRGGRGGLGGLRRRRRLGCGRGRRRGGRGLTLLVVIASAAGPAPRTAATGRGARQRDRGRRLDHRRDGIQPEDAQEKDADGDLQVVVELVMQWVLGLYT